MAAVKNELYEEINAWSTNAIFASPTWSVNQLDYSETSLGIVEVILNEMAETGFALAEEQLTMLAQEYGCYLLISAQKLYGGTFYWNSEFEQPMLIVGEPAATIVLMTWNKVKGRIVGDKADNIVYFIEQFALAAKAPEAGQNVLFM